MRIINFRDVSAVQQLPRTSLTLGFPMAVASGKAERCTRDENIDSCFALVLSQVGHQGRLRAAPSELQAGGTACSRGKLID